jgi:lipopolysaccharide assembly outer membrane protein LptD (OstA)
MTPNTKVRFACFLSLLLYFGQGFAQGKLQLLPGTEKIYAIQNGVHRLVGSVSFAYQGNTMYCDSAHYNEKAKQVQAYGNVHIQKNGINLYADSIFYAEQQKYAKLWGHVKARDNAYKMSADSMDYDAKRGRAIFRSAGTIESTVSDERITCQRGYFYPANGSFFFSGKVHYSKADLDVQTDTLQFAYEQQKLYFLGQTQMRNDSTQIYCRKGWYDVQTEAGALYQQAEIYQKNNIIKADTLLINTKTNDYEGRGSVYFKDLQQQIALLGTHAVSSDTKHFAFITGEAIGFMKYKEDTLYVHADTLYLERDTLNHARFLNAQQNFRFLHPDLQGIGDSTQFSFDTQILTIGVKPILWSHNGELKSQSARVFFKDSILQRIELEQQASVLLELAKDSLYNQIAAKHILATFDSSGVLQDADARGQAWTIFYPVTEKKINDTLVEMRREGLNRLFAERLFVELQKGELRQITYFDQPDGIFYPMKQIEQKERYIKGFEWNPHLRPKNVLELRKD